jgi:hypothetical protein
MEATHHPSLPPSIASSITNHSEAIHTESEFLASETDFSVDEHQLPIAFGPTTNLKTVEMSVSVEDDSLSHATASDIFLEKPLLPPPPLPPPPSSSSSFMENDVDLEHNSAVVVDILDDFVIVGDSSLSEINESPKQILPPPPGDMFPSIHKTKFLSESAEVCNPFISQVMEDRELQEETEDQEPTSTDAQEVNETKFQVRRTPRSLAGKRKKWMDVEERYCICNGFDDGRFMICCDKCETWYHGNCINIEPQKVCVCLFVCLCVFVCVFSFFFLLSSFFFLLSSFFFLLSSFFFLLIIKKDLFLFNLFIYLFLGKKNGIFYLFSLFRSSFGSQNDKK